jgi:hypothetical protein
MRRLFDYNLTACLVLNIFFFFNFPGRASVGYHARRGIGGDNAIHARADSHPRQEGGAHPRRYSPVLRLRREGRVEVGHPLRLVRNPYHHSGRYLLQHAQEGRLAHRKNAPEGLHRLGHGNLLRQFLNIYC